MKLKFIHITKTAGTTIENIGLKKKYLFGSYDSELGFNKRHCLLPTIIPKDIKYLYHYFTIVRNPYTRIISEIGWVYKRFKENNFKHNYVKLFKNYFNQENIINSINTYLEYILNNVDLKYGDHFTPQYKYFEDTKMYINIIKFENLKQEFNDLMKKYKMDLTITNQNYNFNKYKIFNFQHISKKNIQLINKIYKKDFEMFNYNLTS